MESNVCNIYLFYIYYFENKYVMIYNIYNKK